MAAPVGNQNSVGHGAPKGNANRLKSGRRAWSAVKRLPKGCGSIRRQLYAERDEIEVETGAVHGKVSLYHAALIQSAIRHSGRAHLLERWLRVQPEMAFAERIATLREIGNATDSRDKCLKALGLNQQADGAGDDVDELLAAERLLMRHQRRQPALTAANAQDDAQEPQSMPSEVTEAHNGNGVPNG